MFKKSLIAASLLAITAGANAATEVTSTSVEYATELFGTTSVLNNGTIVLTLDADVQASATADVTFTLSEGTFAANPTLAVDGSQGLDNTGAAGVSLKSVGNGSNSVTYTVAVTDALDADDTITLSLVSIADISSLSSDSAVVTVTPAIENTNLVPDGFDESIVSNGETSILAADITVATSTAAIEFAATGVTLDGVDVSDQTQFGGGADAVSATTVRLFNGVELSETGANDEDGAGNALALGANDAVTYTVSGNFAEDAVVCLNEEDDCTTTVIETATIADGVATFELDGVAAVTAATAKVIYIVDGDATIPTGDFEIAAAVDYNASSYVDAAYQEDPAVTTTLGFDGLNPQTNRINIITKPGAADETFIRVTNTTASESAVYITLTTQDGATTVTGELASIGANATAVYTSQDIADAVGVETWSGRGNATILTEAAAADVVVVPLVRTNGVLTNQSGSL